VISKARKVLLKARKSPFFKSNLVSSSQKVDLLFRWVVWTLLIALLLGGKPWEFPENGKFWLEGVG
jgi:hypothetical protein